jgi:ATP-dependent Clp protease ATP-binding subunit ClpA
MAREAIGFTRTKREGDDTEAITRMFSPEFRNRLDATIAFDHLPPEIVRKVVEKFVLQLEAQLAERQINIELSQEAADWIAAANRESAEPPGPAWNSWYQPVIFPMLLREAEELLKREP